MSGEKINVDALKGNDDLIASAGDAVMEIDGVSFREGAGRFSYKVDKFINSLYKFALSLDNTLTKDFGASVSPENEEDTRREVHTLKGTAGNLAVNSIHFAAVDFEKSLKDGAPDESLYESLVRACRNFKTEMEARFEKTGAAGGAAVGAPKDCVPLLNKLRVHLELSEASSCESALAELGQSAAANVYADEYRALRRLVEDYDFDGAMDVTENLLRKIRN